MSRSINKPALAAALTGSLLLSASAFAATPLTQGYMLGADAAAGEKGKDGHGGMAKMDTDQDGRISRAEYAAAHKDGGGNFASHDTDGDGFISAAEMKAHHEGKCGEGKCGEGKCGGDKSAKADASEGKCGEGKCGEGKCGGM